jgi:hypothetical protein
MNTREDDVTRDMLARIRAIRTKSSGSGWGIIKEERESAEMDDSKKTDAIAITDDPKFGQNVLSSQIESFRMQVESGAQFNEADPDKVSDSPLIFMPETKNMVFSGTIPALNNLKWQFVLETNTGSGCFIWSDGLIINKDNIQILNKLFGYYQNWREQWRTEAADLDRMVQNIRDNA